MKNKGFTLIELIIVVAIIGLLAAATFVAIDPAKRIGDANDAQRWADVTSILNGILTYTADSNSLPTQVDGSADVYYIIEDGSANTAPTEITADSCKEVTSNGGLAGMALGSSLVDKYLATMPKDPRITSATSTTQYYIKKSTNGRITVGACEHYQSGSLEVQR